eukprot:g8724.t1
MFITPITLAQQGVLLHNNYSKHFSCKSNNCIFEKVIVQPKTQKPVTAISPDNAKPDTDSVEQKNSKTDRDWDEGNGVRYAGYSARAARVLAVFSKTAKASTRYIAYSSDVGEASRPLVSPLFVKAMYGVAFSYVGYDVYQATTNAVNKAKLESKSEDEVQQVGMRAGAETLYFQLLASIIVPSLIIHTAVHKCQAAVKNSTNVTLRRYGPTALGLAIIPLLPFTIDEPIEHFVDYTFNMVWPHDDDGGHKEPK